MNTISSMRTSFILLCTFLLLNSQTLLHCPMLVGCLMCLYGLVSDCSLFQILRNVLATLSLTPLIVPLGLIEVGCWSVTRTTSHPKPSGTASQVPQEQGCLLRLLPYIIVELMHRAGWMANIRRRRMGLFRGRFASTGAITFVDGTCLSVFVTVGTSSYII